MKCPNQSGNPNIEHLIWVPTASATTPKAGSAGIGAEAAATQAAASITLPSPSIQLNPAVFSVVNLPSWLAIASNSIPGIQTQESGAVGLN